MPSLRYLEPPMFYVAVGLAESSNNCAGEAKSVRELVKCI